MYLITWITTRWCNNKSWRWVNSARPLVLVVPSCPLLWRSRHAPDYIVIISNLWPQLFKLFVLFAVTAVPGPPAAPEVCNVMSTSCTVRYQLPVDEGDAPVTRYHVQRSPVQLAGDLRDWQTVNNTPVTDLMLIVAHLKPRSRYLFRVAAENRFGMSDFGPPSQPITTDNSVCIKLK